ncbi:hypothetical protein RND71_043177 [Anisodus tanguticus]|uniref:Uncharacterized protein n=1 Tax=Anisodus tanguticus TaxID=243964 RepID=A0AAE1QS19_9SOLA|nr:hypothetical protein RND71_043177 [Anisodus tanguticus]
MLHVIDVGEVDCKMAKKVRSPDKDADPLPNVGRVAFSKKYQTACNPRSDMPKTSEYAFFKKLKKDIGHSNSDLLHKRSKLSKIIQPSNCISGSEYSGNGTFAAKRQKLCQRANKLFFDIEKLNSERFDLVPALLSRLFPRKEEDEDLWDSRVRKWENASTSSLAYAKPDHAKTRLHSRHIEDVTVPEYRMSQSDCCPSNFFCKTNERVLLGLDNFTSAFHQIDYDVEAGLHYEDADNSQISNNKLTISLWDQSDPLPSLSFERHGLADDFLQDRLHSANIPVNRGAQNLFLDWDFNEEKNDTVLAITTVGGNKLCSPIATSRHVDYQQSTEKKLDALALCSSSLFTNSGYSDALPYFCSTSFQQKLFPTDFCSKDFRTTLEHEEYAVARMDQFDLPLICNSEEQDPLEDRNLENPFESGNEIIPYLSHQEKNHCDSDALLPMALDTFGWKCLSAASSSLQSVEQPLNSDIWFSCNSEVACEEASGGSLLLLDNASWITSVEEISPDHSDEWIYL